MRNWSVPKKGIIILFMTVCLFAAGIATGSDEDSMNNLFNRAMEIIKQEWELRNMVKGRYMVEGESYAYQTVLIEGYNYLFTASGDRSVKDLEIILYDEDWNEIGKDTKNTPSKEFAPKWTGTFYVKMTMAKGYGYSNVATFYKE